MTLEQRIKKLEETIKDHIDLREWFRSDEWGESRENNALVGEHLDRVLEFHDRNVENCENLLAALRSR